MKDAQELDFLEPTPRVVLRTDLEYSRGERKFQRLRRISNDLRVELHEDIAWLL